MGISTRNTKADVVRRDCPYKGKPCLGCAYTPEQLDRINIRLGRNVDVMLLREHKDGSYIYVGVPASIGILYRCRNYKHRQCIGVSDVIPKGYNTDADAFADIEKYGKYQGLFRKHIHEIFEYLRRSNFTVD